MAQVQQTMAMPNTNPTGHQQQPPSEYDAFKCFIGGLPPNSTEQSLKDGFETQFGPNSVHSTQIMGYFDKFSNQRRSRGFGFVCFMNQDIVDQAIASKWVEVDGKSIEIKGIDAARSQPDAKLELEGRKVFCGGLPDSVDNEKLHAFFVSLDPNLVEVKVMKKPDGTSRGFGYVTFSDKSYVQRASVEQKESNMIDGKWIDVKPSSLEASKGNKNGGKNNSYGGGGYGGGKGGKGFGKGGGKDHYGGGKGYKGGKDQGGHSYGGGHGGHGAWSDPHSAYAHQPPVPTYDPYGYVAGAVAYPGHPAPVAYYAHPAPGAPPPQVHGHPGQVAPGQHPQHQQQPGQAPGQAPQGYYAQPPHPGQVQQVHDPNAHLQQQQVQQQQQAPGQGQPQMAPQGHYAYAAPGAPAPGQGYAAAPGQEAYGKGYARASPY